MRKQIRQTLLMLLILATFSAPALAAEVYIDDSFDDLNKVDLLRTTAEVDTANGWVTLGPKNLANSLLLYTGNYDITLINGDAAETYRYNGAVMKGYVPLSVTGGLHEPVSIAGRMGEYLILERGAREAAWYHYDGSGMVKNGYQAISGLADPRALDVISGTYDFILLDGNSIRRYGYDGSGYLPIAALSVALPEANPLSISVEDDDFAFVILDKAEKAVRYYSLKGGVMREEAGKSVQTGELTNPRSLSVSKDGGLYLIADENQIKAYSYDGSRMVYNPHLSVQGLRKPLAVSLKPDMFDYAVLEQDIADNPQVSYFAFNGSGMTEIPGLRITGLEKITYANHQVLQGKAGEAHHEVSGLQLLAEEALPPGTSIAWEATVDGVNWQTIRPGGVARFAAPGTKPSYRALLHTDDKAVTPKIWSVRLVDASLSVNGFQITGLVGPDIPGNPMLPTDRQVRIWAGYNVHFCITTTGGAESVVADIRAGGETITLSSLLGGIMPDESSGTMMNIWTGTFHTGVGVPAGTPLDISFTVWKGTESAYAEYPEFALIQGSALDLHKIHLTH